MEQNHPSANNCQMLVQIITFIQQK